nr:hypothetical protein [Tanacetum cinerariifolium]
MKDFWLDTLSAARPLEFWSCLVVTITGFRDLNEEFTKCIDNSSNGVNAVGSLVSVAELNFTNSTNNFSAAGP